MKAKLRTKENENPTLLDIGSGKGILLDIAKELNFRAKGVELSSKLAHEAIKNGHEVFNCDISEFKSSEKYDVITMMDIVEHLEAPKDILQNLKKILKPTGEIIIYTPNHNSLIVKIAHLMYKIGIKSGIENIFASTHTCFFTTQTLKKILADSNYNVIEYNHFKYDTSRPGQKVSLIEKFIINIIEFIGTITANEGFRIVIYSLNDQ